MPRLTLPIEGLPKIVCGTLGLAVQGVRLGGEGLATEVCQTLNDEGKK